MIGRKTLFTAIVVQAIGALATLLATVLVSRHYGPDGQGYWANFKSIVDLLTVVCAYGFPYSFPFVMNAHGVGAARLCAFSRRYFLLSVPFLTAGLYAASASGLFFLDTKSLFEFFAIAGSIVFLSWHAALRGISLSACAPRAYNAITIMPPVFLCGLLFFWRFEDRHTLPWVMLLAGAFSLGLSRTVLRLCAGATDTDSPLDKRELLRYGLGVFAANLAAASVAAIIYQLLRSHSASASVIGYMSIGFLVQGAAVIPANMAGPFVFNSWSRRGALGIRESYVQVGRWTLIWSMALWALAAAAVPWLLPAIVGTRFAEAVPLSQILLVSVPVAYWFRLAGHVLTSSGWVRQHATAWVLRAAVTALLVAASLDAGPAAAAWSWVIGEILGLVISLHFVKRLSGWPWSAVLLLRAGSAAVPARS